MMTKIKTMMPEDWVVDAPLCSGLATAFHQLACKRGANHVELLNALGMLIEFLHSSDVMAMPLGRRLEAFDDFIQFTRRHVAADATLN